MIFVIPLRSKKTSLDWSNVCLRLKSTIDSILSQSLIGKKVKILIAGHEKPDFLDNVIYQHVIFLSVPFSCPKDKSEYMLDKLNKKKFSGVYIKKNLMTDDNNVEIIMQMDADDIIHPEFVANVYKIYKENPYADDIALMSGYAFDFKRNKLAYLNGIEKIFYRNCGSSFISKVKKNDLPNDLNSACYFNYLSNHVHFPEISAKNGRRVYEAFYPGVMYIVNHGTNDVSERNNGDMVIQSFIDTYYAPIEDHPQAVTMITKL